MEHDKDRSLRPDAAETKGSAVEEVERLWNRDCGEVRTWYQLALDLARRLDYTVRNINTMAEVAEQKLERRDALLREAVNDPLLNPFLRDRIQKELA